MWIYNGEKIDNIDKVPKDSFGFVYIITNLTNGKQYIGTKQLFFKRKRNFGKKEIEELKDKRLKKYEIITKESNWLTYTGSNSTLNNDIKKGHKIKKEILMFVNTKKQLTYYEVRALMCNNVLESNDYYNDNILGKFYGDSVLKLS